MQEYKPYTKKYYPQDYIFKYALNNIFPKSITPNQMTVLRLLMTPFVLFFLLIGNLTVGMPLFIIAALTDMFDGSIARVRNQITDWGIKYDPVADKLLIGSVTLLFVVRYLNVFLALGMVGIEIVQLTIAFIMRGRRGPIPSNLWGKFKMTLQVIGVVFVMIGVVINNNTFIDIAFYILVVSIVLALIALLSYIMEYQAEQKAKKSKN